MTRLVLIRHGATDWNRQKRYCGCKDIDLSREGRLQARKLRRRLGKVKFDKIYSSDRRRAIQTARILFGQAKIIREPGLREINFGVLEGLHHEEIMGKYADIYEKWLKDVFKNNIPRAEPMDLFERRVKGALEKIVRSNPGKTVAVVCHGGVIGIFVKDILKGRNFWRCIPSPASITVVGYGAGKQILKKFNDTAHMKGKR